MAVWCAGPIAVASPFCVFCLPSCPGFAQTRSVEHHRRSLSAQGDLLHTLRWPFSRDEHPRTTGGAVGCNKSRAAWWNFGGMASCDQGSSTPKRSGEYERHALGGRTLQPVSSVVSEGFLGAPAAGVVTGPQSPTRQRLMAKSCSPPQHTFAVHVTRATWRWVALFRNQDACALGKRSSLMIR